MMKQIFLTLAVICMSLIEAKRPMLKKNHQLYQYTSSSEKLGIPTISTLPKKSKANRKSKFNNKSAGPYLTEEAKAEKKKAAANKTVILDEPKQQPEATEHP